MGQSPKKWLTEQRQKRAVKFMHDGNSVKETADHIGYKHTSTFTREFKKYWGSAPTGYPIPNQPSPPMNDA
jgi:AraC-like DNA-binding protein